MAQGCTTPDCGRRAVALGLCATCYQRQRRGGAARLTGLVRVSVRLPLEVVARLRRHPRGIAAAIRELVGGA
jgi:hypothetical protein